MRILFLIFFILFSLPQLAQYPEDGVLNFFPEESLYMIDSLVTNQKHCIQELYHKVISQSNEILNGREYKYYFYPQVSSPLIPQNPVPTSSIIIQGKKYENIMILYDTYKDLVVYYDPNNLINNSICPIVIDKHLINEFTLQLPSDRLRFKYLEFPDDQKEKLRNGFYEIAYDGYCRYIIKHTSGIVIAEGRNTYKYNTQRYIVNTGIYYRISGRRSLLRALSDKSNELKKYIRTSKIPVRSAGKDQIKNILEYYNSLLLP